MDTQEQSNKPKLGFFCVKNEKEKTKATKQTDPTNWAHRKGTGRKSMNGTGVNVEGIPESGTPDGIMSSEGHPRPSATRGWRSVGEGVPGQNRIDCRPPPHGVIPPHGATEPSLHVADPTLRTKDPPRPSSSFCHFRYLPFLLLSAHPGRLGVGVLNTSRYSHYEQLS